MVNEALMELRRNNPILLVQTENEYDEPVEASIIDQLSAEELFTLITKLPDGYRTVFNLYVVEGFSHQEIAQTLGISEGTSKWHLSEARKFLQQQLQHLYN